MLNKWLGQHLPFSWIVEFQYLDSFICKFKPAIKAYHQGAMKLNFSRSLRV